MPSKLTAKQEKFVLNLLQGMTQYDAYIKAGYSNKPARAIIDINAHILSRNNKVLLRLQELNKASESAKVMSVQERKERLSEIARARLTDYQESGQDGGWINIGPESPNTAAISEIMSTTKYDENGASPTLITRIRLHNPVNAIQELNKMDRIYSDGSIVNIDNRKLTLVLQSEASKQILEEMAVGKEPQNTAIPQLTTPENTENKNNGNKLASVDLT